MTLRSRSDRRQRRSRWTQPERCTVARITTATEAGPSDGDGAASPYQPEAPARDLPNHTHQPEAQPRDRSPHDHPIVIAHAIIRSLACALGLVSAPAGALTALRTSYAIVATSPPNQRWPVSSAGAAAGSERLTSELKLRDGLSRSLDDQQPGTCPQFRQSAYDRTFLPRQQCFRKIFSLRNASQLRARGSVVTSVDSKRALVR